MREPRSRRPAPIGEASAPTRAAVLARYRPIRASIQAVLAEAVGHCWKPDLDRAAKHLDLVEQAQLDDEETGNMLLDVALFEPDGRGRRAFDRFLDEGLATLDPAHHGVARGLAAAFFSIFRVAGWHEAGGVHLDDLLAPGRRLWLMDEGLEATAPEGLVVAMRAFDAGPFHAGLGIVVQPDAEAVALCAAAAARGERPPVRHSLAAALYGDAIAAAAPPAGLDAVGDLLDALDEARKDARAALTPPARSRRDPAKRGGRR